MKRKQHHIILNLEPINSTNWYNAVLRFKTNFLSLSFILFFLCYSLSSSAQDIHYSQFYTDILRLNPSMTGNFNGDYRVGANYLQQWKSVPVPYQTVSAYADLGWLKKDNKRGGRQSWLGTGLRALYDRAGDGLLSTSEIQGTFSAHLGLTDNLYLSIGAGATFTQKSIDFERLYFSDQWNGIDFSEGSTSIESLNTESFSYLDLQGGLTISYSIPEKLNVYLGASMLHINKPNASFQNSDNEIGQRLIVNAGTSILVNQLGIEPAAYFTTQKKASELVLGTNVFYQAGQMGNYDSPIRLYAGLWLRNKDAIIPLVGFEMLNNRILFSYDINISELKPASRGRGGPQISFVHVGSFKKESKTLYCPRF